MLDQLPQFTVNAQMTQVQGEHLVEHAINASSFRSKHHAIPWAAHVGWADGVKPNLFFTGRWTGYRVALRANAGDVIAIGDRRSKGNWYWYVVGSGGELCTTNEASARKHWHERRSNNARYMIEERERLAARIAEIDRLLAQQP